MNKRIAIGAVFALLASLAFATVASASDGFEDGDYTIFLPGAEPVKFTITDGGFASDNPFSDDGDRDEIRITSADVEIEIDADDARIEISGLTAAEAAMVTVAFGDVEVYSQENLPEDWKISFDDDPRSDDHDSVDDDTRSDDDDSVDDDTRSDDDDSVDDDSVDDDALSEDDDSASDGTRATTADDDDSDSADDDSASTDDDDSVDDDDDSESADDDSVDDGSDD